MKKTTKTGTASPIVNMTPQEIIKVVSQAVDPLIAARHETLKTILMAEIKEVKQDMSGMKQDIKELKQGQERIEQRVKGLEQGQKRIEHKLDTAVQDHEEQLQRIKMQLGSQ